MSRAVLLKPKPVYPHQACPAVQSKPKFVPTFIITYNPHNPELRKWLQEVHFILSANPKLAEIYPNPPSVTFRQPRNLKQILCRNTLRNLPYREGGDLGDNPPGCYKHNHGGRGRRCLLCPTLKEGREFSSTYTGLTYYIKHNFTCKSKFVIYLITCKQCNKQSTGKTRQKMHTRHTGHRSEVENLTSELGEHFSRCGIENISLQIIDCVKEGEDEALSVLEGYWQNKLATFKANGGNINLRNEWRNYLGQQPILF